MFEIRQVIWKRIIQVTWFDQFQSTKNLFAIIFLNTSACVITCFNINSIPFMKRQSFLEHTTISFYFKSFYLVSLLGRRRLSICHEMVGAGTALIGHCSRTTSFSIAATDSSTPEIRVMPKTNSNNFINISL